MKKIILIFSILLFFTTAYTKNNTLRLDMLKTNQLQKDIVFSRTPRVSSPYGISISHSYIFDKYQINSYGDISYGKFYTFNNTSNEGIKAISTFATGIYYKTSFCKEKLSCFIGSKLVFDSDFTIDTLELRYGWDISFSNNIALKLQYHILDNISLTYDIDAYLLGILWRPNALGYTLATEVIQETKGIISSSLEKSFLVNIFNTTKQTHKLEAIYKYNDKINIFSSFTLKYTNISIPKKKVVLQNTFTLGIGYEI